MGGKEKEKVFISTELGELLRKARMDRKMTQEELADDTGVSQTDISRIERGAHQAMKDKIIRLCDFFGWEFEKLSSGFKPVKDQLDVNYI